VVALAALSLPFCTLSVTGCDSNTDVTTKTTVTGVQLIRGQVAANVPDGVPVAGDEHVATESAQVALAAGVISMLVALGCLLWTRRQGLQAALMLSGAAAVLILAAPGLLRFEGGIPVPTDPNSSTAGLEGYTISVEYGWVWAIIMAELAVVVLACVVAYVFAPSALAPRRAPGWGRCFGSAFIDTCCVLFATWGVSSLLPTGGVVQNAAAAFWLSLVFVAPLYCIGFQISPMRATLGAVFAEIAIVDRDGAVLTRGRALTRSLALVATRVGAFAGLIGERHFEGDVGVLLCVAVSLLVPLLLFGRRSLHDIAADTRLVHAARAP
jgi:hypothetical protein